MKASKFTDALKSVVIKQGEEGTHDGREVERSAVSIRARNFSIAEHKSIAAKISP